MTGHKNLPTNQRTNGPNGPRLSAGDGSYLGLCLGCLRPSTFSTDCGHGTFRIGVTCTSGGRSLVFIEGREGGEVGLLSEMFLLSHV